MKTDILFVNCPLFYSSTMKQCMVCHRKLIRTRQMLSTTTNKIHLSTAHLIRKCLLQTVNVCIILVINGY